VSAPAPARRRRAGGVGRENPSCGRNGAALCGNSKAREAATAHEHGSSWACDHQRQPYGPCRRCWGRPQDRCPWLFPASFQEQLTEALARLGSPISVRDPIIFCSAPSRGFGGSARVRPRRRSTYEDVRTLRTDRARASHEMLHLPGARRSLAPSRRRSPDDRLAPAPPDDPPRGRPGHHRAHRRGRAAHRMASQSTMRAQREHIARLAETLATATIGIVPFSVQAPIAALHGWPLIDDLVTIETEEGEGRRDETRLRHRADRRNDYLPNMRKINDFQTQIPQPGCVAIGRSRSSPGRPAVL
jgi:hypothetical protein